MGSVGFGLLAALIWGAGALYTARFARSAEGVTFVQWFLIAQTALLLPPLLAFADWGSITAGGVAIICLAGVSEAVAAHFYGLALTRGDVGLVTPLISLEGAVAAILGLTLEGSDTVSAPLLLGLAVASTGGLLAGGSRGGGWSSRGAPPALAAAFFFGTALWLIAITSLDPISALFIFYAAASVFTAFRTGFRGLRLPGRGRGALLLGSLGSVGGFVVYGFGAQGDSIAITAVLGAQFSVVAAAGGFVFFGERLTVRQWAAVPVVAAGVALIALATS